MKQQDDNTVEQTGKIPDAEDGSKKDKVAKNTTETDQLENKDDANENDKETIENILSFIQSESPIHKGETHSKGREADRRKEEESRAEQAVAKAKKDNAKRKSSVYDLEPEGEEFAGKSDKKPSNGFEKKKRQFRLTDRLYVTGPDATPFVTLPAKEEARRRTFGKKDNMTKIGNNTYFYTGPKSKRASTEDDDLLGEAPDDDDDEDQAILISNVGGSLASHWCRFFCRSF